MFGARGRVGSPTTMHTHGFDRANRSGLDEDRSVTVAVLPGWSTANQSAMRLSWVEPPLFGAPFGTDSKMEVGIPFMQPEAFPSEAFAIRAVDLTKTYRSGSSDLVVFSGLN